jgi:hypothetical protein
MIGFIEFSQSIRIPFGFDFVQQFFHRLSLQSVHWTLQRLIQIVRSSSNPNPMQISDLNPYFPVMLPLSGSTSAFIFHHRRFSCSVRPDKTECPVLQQKGSHRENIIRAILFPDMIIDNNISLRLFICFLQFNRKQKKQKWRFKTFANTKTAI